MSNQNITLSLPEEDRQEARILAASREGMDLGTDGHIGWSRDDVHER